MAGVVDELKAKLAELEERLEAIRAEQAVLHEEKQAFEIVIACYDPSFRPSGAVTHNRTVSPGAITPTKRVTALLKGKNPRHVVLAILRNADRPVATAEVGQIFVGMEELGGQAEGLSSHITSRFATVLNGLQKQGLVRFELSEDGSNRRLWQIAR
jgi:hypothetical protein